MLTKIITIVLFIFDIIGRFISNLIIIAKNWKAIRKESDIISANTIFGELGYLNECFIPEPLKPCWDVFKTMRPTVEQWNQMNLSEKQSFVKELNAGYSNVYATSTHRWMRVFAPLWKLNNLFISRTVNYYDKLSKIYIDHNLTMA